jgi:hypothetical protein
MMKSLIKCTVVALASAGVASTFAQPQGGDWEFTLGGSGNANNKFSTGGFGLSGSVGYFFNENFETALRQNWNYDTSGPNDQWSGATRLAADWHFLLGNFVPFVGANVGLDYNRYDNSWGVGPELGFKYYVHERTFILAMGEYRWNFDRIRDIDNNSDNGTFVFTVGVGFAVGGRR